MELLRHLISRFSYDNFVRRIRLRADEMRYPPLKPVKSKKAAAKEEKERKWTQRHPKEAPFINEKDYGKILMPVQKGVPGWFDGQRMPIMIQDLFEHVMVFGGSGTGKTYSVLQPLWEECFRSTSSS